jgi:DNA-binding NarL/FixJ family response regulator
MNLSDPSSKTTIVLIDDDAPFRSYIGALLESTDEYIVAASVGDLAQGREAVQCLHPALVLLDVELPDGLGSEAVDLMLRGAPSSRIVMLSAHDDEDVLLASIRAGACGYLTKGLSSAAVLAALEDALKGGAPMSPGVARKLMDLVRQGVPATAAAVCRPEAGVEPLTPREKQILALVVEGLLDKEIAAKLGIAVSTVKNQLASVYLKWRVRSRTEAAVRYVRQGGAGTTDLSSKAR